MAKTVPRLWTESAVFQAVAKILHQVAPLKVTGPVFPETSLAEDLDFDSLDAVDMMIAVNEHFSIELDFEAWITGESLLSGKAFTLGSFCRSVKQALGKE